MVEFNNLIPKIGFLFVVFVVVAGGYINDILSCQMQEWLTDSVLARHILGVLLIFFFIMLEGGWDFDEEENNKTGNDWSSGNTLHSSVYAIGIYIIFVLISNSRLIYNLITFTSLFVLYYINSYKNYLQNRDRISDETVKRIEIVEIVLITLACISAVVGLVDYVIYQKKLRGKTFSWRKLIYATTECDYNKRKASRTISK